MKSDDTNPPAEGDAGHPETLIDSVDERLTQENHVVLVVDDERSVRRLICKEIHFAAPSVLTVEAGDREQALEKLADIRTNFKCDPILIVLDLKMPAMDGWEVIEALKEEYEGAGSSQGIPLIVLSSTSGEKRHGLSRQSIHGDHADYIPLVSVAKENCVAPLKYDAIGKQGLLAWVRHFVGVA